MSVHIFLIYAVLAVFVAIWISHRRDHEYLRSKEFNLFHTTEGGNVKEIARMEAWAGGGGLSFFNKKGEEFAFLGLGAADVPVRHSGEVLRHIRLGTLDSLIKTIPTLCLKAHGQVLLTDENDRLRARLGLNDRGEASLSFYDDAGNVTWKAP